MPKLRNSNNGDSNQGSLDCESGILPTELPRSGVEKSAMRMRRFASLAWLRFWGKCYSININASSLRRKCTSHQTTYPWKSYNRHLIAHLKNRSAVRVVYRGPFMSEDRSFGLSTALFHVTMYRQYARKVGTSANSALIRYYLPSIALFSRKRGDERLVI